MSPAGFSTQFVKVALQRNLKLTPSLWPADGEPGAIVTQMPFVVQSAPLTRMTVDLSFGVSSAHAVCRQSKRAVQLPVRLVVVVVVVVVCVCVWGGGGPDGPCPL